MRKAVSILDFKHSKKILKLFEIIIFNKCVDFFCNIDKITQLNFMIQGVRLWEA